MPAGNREGGEHRGRPIMGRRLPQEDTADARAKVRCPADGERLNVEWSLLEPSRVGGGAGPNDGGSAVMVLRLIVE